MSVFNSGYIIYDARIGVIKSIYAAILSVCPHCGGVGFSLPLHVLKYIFAF